MYQKTGLVVQFFGIPATGEIRTGKGVGKTGLVFPWRKNRNRGVSKP